jgi:hypothetical protein
MTADPVRPVLEWAGGNRKRLRLKRPGICPPNEGFKTEYFHLVRVVEIFLQSVADVERAKTPTFTPEQEMRLRVADRIICSNTPPVRVFRGVI